MNGGEGGNSRGLTIQKTSLNKFVKLMYLGVLDSIIRGGTVNLENSSHV